MSKNQQPTAKAVQVELMGIDLIEPNEGQIDGVPVNPRTISETQFKRLVNSLKETPDMLNHRQLIVYPLDNGHYVTIGGNQRLRALQTLGYNEVPVSILDKDTPAEAIRAMIIKDNASFGDWDMDLLANEWDADPLVEWGLDTSLPSFVPNEDDDIENDKAATELSNKQMTLSFELSPDMYSRVYAALIAFDEDIDTALVKALGLYE